MSEYRYTLAKFLKDWMLVIAMLTGAGIYLIYHWIPSPELHAAGPALELLCKKIQPVLLFAMLFLSFSKVEPRQLKLRGWHWWILLLQGGIFAAAVGIIILAVNGQGPAAAWIEGNRIPIESAMLCIICPTATACAVVTGKLGGDMAGVLTYTVLVNLMVAVMVPLMVPLIYPVAGIGFWFAFKLILAKVFPLLIMPCVAAWIIRYFLPKLHARILGYTQVSFYIWVVSLTLAILMSTRAIVNDGAGIKLLSEIALASLIACAFQFWAGKLIGSRYGARITAGQAMGQKNTVFAIWMGYTFLNPIVSIAGGFYSIWHNCFNSWQLYRRRKGLPL